MSVLGNLKSLFHRYLPGGLLCFLSKKTVNKNEDSISNVDLSSAANQPINIKLRETLVLLNHANDITRN